MLRNRISTFFCFGVLLALLVTSLPMSSSVALKNPQETTGGCLPPSEALEVKPEFLKMLPLECRTAIRQAARPNQQPNARFSPLTLGGPDGFGYMSDDSVSYSLISASTNSGVTGDDNFSGPVNLGFSFPFYGISYTQLYFNTNGLITFGSGSSSFSGSPIPTAGAPDNFIASFWDDLAVGGGFNTGAIYTSQLGVAPNRTFVVEWRNVTELGDNTPFTFEAILHENGDVEIQYASLPPSYFSAIGIEDASGTQGLQYFYGGTFYGASGLAAAPNAIYFTYPAAAARVRLLPAEQADFASAVTTFPLTITNTGALGTDSYDLTASSTWPVALYAADGTTPLTDTNGDASGTPDTGDIAPGSSVTIYVAFTTPGTANIGDANAASLTAASFIDNTRTKTASFTMSIAPDFAGVFEDDDNGAMSLMIAGPAGESTVPATPDFHYGTDPAVIGTPDGNYLYAWDLTDYNGNVFYTNIEYSLVGHDGSLLLPATMLANNVGATSTLAVNDYYPSVAVAPNGTIGLMWQRYLFNDTTGEHNSNIYFATLSSTGALLSGPINLTNNNIWLSYGEFNKPEYTGPGIAATDDNRFILNWGKDVQVAANSWQDNLWYATYTTAAVSVFAPAALTSNNVSMWAMLNPLVGGKAILTWVNAANGRPYYAVINSSGVITKAATSLPSAVTFAHSPDAVGLADGGAAVAWGSSDAVQLAILDPAYNLSAGPSYRTNPFGLYGSTNLSVALVHSGLAISWTDYFTSQPKRLYFVLGNYSSAMTSPVPYKISHTGVYTSSNGQGLAQAAILISGNAGAPGVTLSYNDNGAKTATANGSGDYSFVVSDNWTGTVTPSKNCYNFSPSNTGYTNVAADQVAQDYTATLNLACADIDVAIGGSPAGNYLLAPSQSTRTSFAGVNNGVVQVASTNAVPLISAERVIYNVNGTQTSFSEMMGLPNSLLNTTYWLPWYNNVDLDTQLRFGNVSGSTAHVHVSIGGTEMPGSPLTLLTGQSTRVSFVGVNDGPVKIESDVSIVAAERVIYTINGTRTSFSEMMALPNSQLNATYWLPWYNNVDLDTQLRFGNVGGSTAHVHVSIGGTEMPGSPFTLLTGQSTRVSFAGVNDGPVKIESDASIVAAERVIYAVNGTRTSFSEMMALPNIQLNTTYWLPWYNNVDLDTQLRFGNVSGSTAHVHVFIGGAEMTGSPFTLLTGQSTRVSFAGVNAGPVKIESDVPVVAAERVIYTVNGTRTSFSEMMGLPDSLLDTAYWLPWYNNVDLDTQLRFGVP